MLNLPDFRSGGELFNCWSIGGSRRSWEYPGKVLVQTSEPEHPVVQSWASAELP